MLTIRGLIGICYAHGREKLRSARAAQGVRSSFGSQSAFDRYTNPTSTNSLYAQSVCHNIAWRRFIEKGLALGGGGRRDKEGGRYTSSVR